MSRAESATEFLSEGPVTGLEKILTLAPALPNLNQDTQHTAMVLGYVSAPLGLRGWDTEDLRRRRCS